MVGRNGFAAHHDGALRRVLFGRRTRGIDGVTPQARDSWARARERGNVVSVTVLTSWRSGASIGCCPGSTSGACGRWNNPSTAGLCTRSRRVVSPGSGTGEVVEELRSRFVRHDDVLRLADVAVNRRAGRGVTAMAATENDDHHRHRSRHHETPRWRSSPAASRRWWRSAAKPSCPRAWDSTTPVPSSSGGGRRNQAAAAPGRTVLSVKRLMGRPAPGDARSRGDRRPERRPDHQRADGRRPQLRERGRGASHPARLRHGRRHLRRLGGAHGSVRSRMDRAISPAMSGSAARSPRRSGRASRSGGDNVADTVMLHGDPTKSLGRRQVGGPVESQPICELV